MNSSDWRRESSFVKFNVTVTDFRTNGRDKVYFLDFSHEINIPSDKFTDYDLGLTITKQIVEKMDGSVSVEKTPDCTTFKLGF